MKAGDAGYAYYFYLELDDGYDFVPVGQKTQAGDETFSVLAGWTLVLPNYTGLIIDDRWAPVRRKRVVRQKVWSCGHPRDEHESCCAICIIFHRNVTE